MVSPKLLLLAVLCSAVNINAQQFYVSLENKGRVNVSAGDFSKTTDLFANQNFNTEIVTNKRVAPSEFFDFFAEKRLKETVENNLSENIFYPAPGFFACTGVGAINFQRWNNITGSSVSNLTSNPNYPNNPSSTGTRTLFEMPVNNGSNFGIRMNGYICPPTTGAYVFFGLPVMQAANFG